MSNERNFKTSDLKKLVNNCKILKFVGDRVSYLGRNIALQLGD